MSGNYAEDLERTRRNAAAAAAADRKKKGRDAGLMADIAAELGGALEPDPAPSTAPQVDTRLGIASAAVAAPSGSSGDEAEKTPPSSAVAQTPRPRRERSRSSAEMRTPEAPPAVQPAGSADEQPNADPSSLIVRQGIDFRQAHLDLVTEMLYRCYSQRIKLHGKKGPSVIVRAALDELGTVYAEDPARFDAIMRRYAKAR